jgi:hypothetical protein
LVFELDQSGKKIKKLVYRSGKFCHDQYILSKDHKSGGKSNFFTHVKLTSIKPEKATETSNVWSSPQKFVG